MFSITEGLVLSFILLEWTKIENQTELIWFGFGLTSNLACFGLQNKPAK